MAESESTGGAGVSVPADEIQAMIRPTGKRNGVMWADPEKCISCGLCIENCPYRCWEMGDDEVPKMKQTYTCFSCFNCMIPCPTDAVSIKETFAMEGGFFDTDFPAFKMPLEPRDAEGNPTEWTDTERLILERRSVRNFKPDPVPETLLRRILEAGRFAPSGGNVQPWKFVVVTDQTFIHEIEAGAQAVWAGRQGAMVNDAIAPNLVGLVEDGAWDPRVQEGVRCTAMKVLPIFLDAPAVIFLGCNLKMVLPEIEAGICGQNMNLAAMAMGLGFVWSNFGAAVTDVPELKAKLGYGDDWKVQTTLCLGYPRFKQQGMVPRHSRPVTWFRAGSTTAEIDA